MEKNVETIDISLIKRQSLRGIVALTSRTFVLQLIAFSATFLLTIFLSPTVFGVFYVVSAIIAFLGYFSDVGLAAALIQKKEALTDDDLITTFTIQQLLVGSVSVVSFIFSGTIASFYKLDEQGLWLLRSLIVAFFLSSLKTIPSVILERKLSFDKLVVPQILETLGFYVVAVSLAWMQYGIASFSWAVLTRAIIRLVAIYALVPWKVRIGISKPAAKKLLHFGIPFQLNSFLALLKDDLLTVALGKILPFAQVGYIGWAKKWAEVPLRLIMDSVVRVTFPAFSRMQHMKMVLGNAIEKSLFGISLLLFPITVGLLFFVKPMVYTIPQYSKWEPALFSFYLFAIGAAIASISVPLTNALNAVGKIRVTLGLMIGWTALTWALTLLFLTLFGFHGYAIALVVVGFSVGIVVHLTKQVAAFSVMKSIGTPLLAAGAQALWYAGALTFIPQIFALYLIVALVGVILYGSIAWLRERSRILSLLSLWRA